MPGSIVFRWYDRARADEVYSMWTVEQLQARLEADKRKEGGAPLGRPGAATTESLDRLLADWRAQGYAQTRISQIPAEHASDRLLRYELICDACSQAEWRAKEAFLIRHVTGLRADRGNGDTGTAGFQPAEGGGLAPDELEAQYAASREGRFRWRDWPALTEALTALEWERWVAAFRASYEADKMTRRTGVERALRDNYEAFEELRRLLKEGEQRGWALVAYNANDERLPFPAPPILADAVRQTEEEIAEAQRAAEAAQAQRRRSRRRIVPTIVFILALLFLVALTFLFTRSLTAGLIGIVLIIPIIGVILYLQNLARADTR